MVHMASASGVARSQWDASGDVKAAWVEKGINNRCRVGFYSVGTGKKSG